MAFTFTSETTVDECIAALKNKSATAQQVVEHYQANLLDLSKAGYLVGVLDGDSFAKIMQGQSDLNDRMVSEAEQRGRKAGAATGGNGVLTIKVGEKGGLTLRGLPGVNPRFGMTMYGLTMIAIAKQLPALLAFAHENAERMSWGKDRDMGEGAKEAREAIVAVGKLRGIESIGK